LTNFALPRIVVPGLSALDVSVWFGILDGLNRLLTLIGAEVVRRRVVLNQPVVVARPLVALSAGSAQRVRRTVAHSDGVKV
jgi:hypothetical protein